MVRVSGGKKQGYNRAEPEVRPAAERRAVREAGRGGEARHSGWLWLGPQVAATVFIMVCIMACQEASAQITGLGTSALEQQVGRGSARFATFFGLLRNVLIYGSSAALACVVGAAFATGRWNNKWFLTLCGGLVFLALVGVFVDFFVVSDVTAPTGLLQ